MTDRSDPIDLYDLLPAAHQREDAGLGYPLEALLDVIATEVGHVQRNITDLWDDFFIETAAEWVVPYLADLVGATPLHNVAGSRRADVANTITYRRRKGTLSMLDDLAADVTGWGARVVDFFELLEWAQHLDHIRRVPGVHPGRSTRVGTADLGDADALDRLDGPFDELAHTVDIRPLGEGRGRHNLHKIGFFLWRLHSYPLFAVRPRQSADHAHGYHFSPLGNTAPLFTNSERPVGAARRHEADQPGSVRPLALHADLEQAAATGATASRYYGPDSHHSLAVAVGAPSGPFGDSAIDASKVCVCDLRDWNRPPPGKHVAIDPARGRFTLSEGREPHGDQVVRVNFCYGFSGSVDGDLGGGPYDRRDSLPASQPRTFHAVVSQQALPGSSAHVTIRAAIDAWLALHPQPHARAVVEVLDSATYPEGDLMVALPTDVTLELRASSGQRPVLDVDELTAQGTHEGGARLVVNGFAILGGLVRVGVGLTALVLRHCTLVPGRSFTPEGTLAAAGTPSLVATDDAQTCHVSITHSILGPIVLPAETFTLAIADSIVDATTSTPAIAGPDNDPGPTCDLRRVTVLGDVHVRSLGYASEVIFDAAVTSQRTQVGCVRFSWVPFDAITPVRYRCQPDIALDDADDATTRSRVQTRLRPRYTSRVYGQPGYAQLGTTTAAELKTGGANGSEMGAFNRLREPQREANLRLRLDEYLPAGLEASLIYVT